VQFVDKLNAEFLEEPEQHRIEVDAFGVFGTVCWQLEWKVPILFGRAPSKLHTHHTPRV
jgi:hypothetical protein